MRKNIPFSQFFPQSFAWVSAMLVLLPILLCVQTARAGEPIDIMVVYESKAQNWVSGQGGMQTFAEDAVNRMNQAMENSKSPVRYRLVHVMPVSHSFNSNGLSGDLDALQAGNGAFSAVAAARDQYGADLVTMLVDTGSPYGNVGLAYMLADWRGSPGYAHAVCAIRSVAISHTMTHEVGHNLGAGHARGQYDPGPNDALDDQYSAGYYFDGSNGVSYHTIMAYDEDDFGNRYTEAPLFSTPLVKYQGVAAGKENWADNVRLLSATGSVIAGYRPAKLGPGTGCSDSSRKSIYKSYIGYYGRCPDPSGFNYWCSRLDSAGGDLGEIIAAFGTSAEYTSVYGSLTDRGTISLLYQNMFARTPEAGGVTFYLGRLEDLRREWNASHPSSAGASEYALSRIALDVLNGASGGDLTRLTSSISACPAF